MTNINLTMNKWHLQDKMPYIYLGESGENNVVVLNVEVDDLITSTNDTKVTYFVDIYNQDNLQVANTQPFDIVDNKLVTKLTKGFLTVNGIKKLQIRCVVTDNDYNELQTYLSNQIHASVGQGNFGTTYNTDLADVDTSCKLIIEIFEKFQELFDITNDLEDDIAQQESDLNNLDGIAQKFENIDDGDVDTLLDVRYIYFVTNSLHLPTNGKYLVMPLGNTSVCYGQCAINCETQAIYFRNNEIENDVIIWHEWVSSNDAQEREIQQIKNDVQTLSNNVDTLSDNVDDLHTNIEGLDNDVDNLEDNLSQLQSNVNGLSNNVQTLNSSVDNLSGDVQTLQNDINSLNSDVQTLGGNVSDIQDDIDNIWKTQGELGAKNLISYPYYTGKSYTTNGITFNVNDDGSVTLNGTSTGWTSFYLNRDKALKAGTYIISSNSLPKNVYLTFKDLDNNINYNCTENVQSITLSFDEDFLCSMFFQTQPNVTLDNFVIYPMLRYATDIDPTWQPYAPTNRELFLNKMDNVNPTGTGALSINRKANTTIGVNSVTEGNDCTASANYSHAEGDNSRATSIGAHAEGNYSVARGSFSHAEGRSDANGAYSHTQNYNTIAENNSQTAIGKNNDNKSTTLFEVGNGADANNRSNAFEVYSDGSLSTDNGTTKVKLEDVVNNIDDIWKVNGELGAKNLIPYPYENFGTLTANGITFVLNDDGSITINGTATANIYKLLIEKDFGNAQFSSKYNNPITQYIITLVNGTSDIYCNYNPSDHYVTIVVNNGTTVDNLTVYPMLRYKSDKDKTWQPYAPTNRKLKQELDDDINGIWKIQGEFGAKNLLKTPYATPTPYTTAGITFSDSEDGGIIINGTSTVYSILQIIREINALPHGEYILSTQETLPDGVVVQLGYVTQGENPTFVQVGRNNTTTPSTKVTIDNTFDGNLINIRIGINAGVTLNNFVVHSMLRYAADSDNTWQPYVPTNKELEQELYNNTNAIWKAQEELGAKNLIKYPYLGRSTTNNGIKFTANDDGSIYVNGTSTSYATYHIFRQVNGFKKGNYTISCERLTQGVEFQFGTVIDGTFNVVVTCNTTSPSKSLVIDSTYDDVMVGLRVMVSPQITIDNRTIYPMVRLASDPNDTWTPYVPTNKELADNMEIIDISDSFYTELAEGIMMREVAVYKQGKHIFGNFELTNLPTDNATHTVLFVTFQPQKSTVSYYRGERAMKIQTSGALLLADTNVTTARIHLDYVCK